MAAALYKKMEGYGVADYSGSDKNGYISESQFHQ